ncbi:YciI family protein [Actinomycetospora straminea]|uniref:YciI family protein n=1 Tax=Actinomycetospora straminea TaxID=663607 RepID=A0ABP9ELD4_9PSEU|nr:YciI family protein [Actinomycetospora straminea]MDD7934401.1 YciI family protein [Actinomycetospora straminea]
MAHYLLSVITPAEGEPPSDTEMQEIMGRVAQLQQDMQEAGVWVFSGGLEAPDTATVLSRSGDDVLVTDGPFVELKEYVGGLTIIDAPDLDAALHWGRRSTEAVGLAIEVRPFHWAP